MKEAIEILALAVVLFTVIVLLVAAVNAFLSNPNDDLDP